MITTPPVSTQELALFLEGEVTLTRASQIRDQLETCAISRQRLQDLQGIRTQLHEDDELLVGVDLVPGLHDALARRGATVTPLNRMLRFAAAGGVLLAAASVLFLVGRTPVLDSEFTAKGSGARADGQVGIQAFRSADGGKATPLGPSMRAGDALMFSYTNQGKAPYAFLMILAVDAGGRVYWYHPAFLHEGQPPTALHIRAGAGREELADMVEHQLPAGPLVIYGVFSNTSLGAAEVEARVRFMVTADGWNVARAKELPLEGTVQQLLRVEVK